MTVLYPVFDDETKALATTADVGNLPMMREFFEETSLNEGFTVTMTLAEDDDRVEYRDVEFVVSARYKRDGDTWLAGGGFHVNVSDLMARITEILQPTTI